MTSLFDSTLVADTASIDTGAGGIAGGYGALLILLILRTDEAGAISNALLRFNADSGSNYDVIYVQANNTTVSGQTALAGTSVLAIVHGSGGSANYAAAVNVTIPNYDRTTFYKTGSMLAGANDGTGSNNWQISREFTWRSTAAITRVSVAAAGTAKLKAGSRMIIYGMP